MASYKINKHAAVAVNVGNLFNKRYYTNARGNFYGKPRSVNAVIKIRW
jgi:putative tonB-dependent receptor|nr:TonB-dependent receptor [Neisseria bacilliformis]